MGFFAGKLRKYLPEGATEKDKVGGTLANVKGVHELLADTLEATEKLDILEALRAASPWAEAVGSALGDALPPVKFVLKLFGELTKIEDPNELGYLAVTLAYQRAVEQAWSAMPAATRVKLGGADAQVRKKALAELRSAAPAESYDFSRFTFADALSSAFVRDADAFLEMSTRGLGLDEADFLVLQREVRHRFVPNLKGVLSHGSTREKFAPFRDSLKLESLEARAYDALLEHADYQRWLFEEHPVLGHEPFTLAQVYTDLDCGVLRWDEIDRKVEQDKADERIDPFDGKHGGRHPLIDTVFGLIADPKFRDAIVIQGVAGSGKSSSTLRLAWELVRQGLRPIRVELKHLDVRDSATVEVALPEAVRMTSLGRHENADSLDFGKELFRDGAIFQESIYFRGIRICPYVLILDGWDEIKITGSEGYQQRVERMLESVRQLYLGGRAIPIRVVLAGRPSHAIQKSKFLRDETPILTVRDLLPDQLEAYVEKVRAATTEARQSGAASWSLAQVNSLPSLLNKYRQEHEARRQDRRFTESLEILGLPLLAHLALRLLAVRPTDAEELLENTTSLYRHLVDMVVGQAGKPAEAKLEGSAMIQGAELRRLLRETAEAMTNFGAESIPFEELALRLERDEEEVLRQADSLADQHFLSRLMISFFFRGGRKELGAEFSHKSFREYLFAEQIVEALKKYGREAPEFLPERRSEEPWKDFDPNDPRNEFCHRLVDLLGPVWLTREVAFHVRLLLLWEIARSDDTLPSTASPSTTSLTRQQWRAVRDGLTDAWDWWGEGVHLRPQPTREEGLWLYKQDKAPLALKVVEKKRLRSDKKQCPVPARLTTIDAHLGDGLCLLVAVVYAAIAENQTTSDSEDHTRRYQSLNNARLMGRVVFNPSGWDRSFFLICCARINAEGGRPAGLFPSHLYLSGVDLKGSDLSGVFLRGAELSRADLSRADLRGADLIKVDLFGAELSGAELTRADLREADLFGADLSEANLSGADLSGAYLSGAKLYGADLTRADLKGADLTRADLRQAYLSGANLSGAYLNGADLRAADLTGTPVDPGILTFAILKDPEPENDDDP